MINVWYIYKRLSKKNFFFVDKIKKKYNKIYNILLKFEV